MLVYKTLTENYPNIFIKLLHEFIGFSHFQCNIKHPERHCHLGLMSQSPYSQTRTLLLFYFNNQPAIIDSLFEILDIYHPKFITVEFLGVVCAHFGFAYDKGQIATPS